MISLYQGLGSEIAAEDVNELQNPVSAIIQQTVVYNWPSAPSVTWALAPNSVINSSISATAAISLTKLQALSPFVSPVTNGSGILIYLQLLQLNLAFGCHKFYSDTT